MFSFLSFTLLISAGTAFFFFFIRGSHNVSLIAAQLKEQIWFWKLIVHNRTVFLIQ
jgi:hypothetical protein